MTWYVVRPLQWAGPRTPVGERRHSQFKAGWTDTLRLLETELANLDAKNVVWQLDYQDSDLRINGELKANAKHRGDPGVRILFDSRHGPLVYATDQYWEWRDNVRAIALSLQALRAVDRHGVTRGAEQYKGFRAIGATPMGSEAPMTEEEAAAFVREHSGRPDVSVTLDTYKAAARRLHPDQGGSTFGFQRLQEAKRVLGL